MRDIEAELVEAKAQIDAAVDLAFQYGNIDGDHHKQWVIDQMIRILTGDQYEVLVGEACKGDFGFKAYNWDVGVAP